MNKNCKFYTNGCEVLDEELCNELCVHAEYLTKPICDSGWINCNNELPKKQGHYLVYAPLSFPKNCKCVVAEFYDDNNTFYSESSDMPMEDVTHWMPLPNYPSNK